MNNKKINWDALAESWQGEEPNPLGEQSFRARLEGRRRTMLLVVLGELALTIGLIWLTISLSGPASVGADAVLLTVLWVSWAVATGFAWWNRRGQWRVSVASSQEFLQLSLDRATKKIRVARFSAGLLILQALFVTWLWLSTAETGPAAKSPSAMLLLLLTMVIVYTCWTIWYYRRARREHGHYSDLLGSMNSAEGQSP